MKQRMKHGNKVKKLLSGLLLFGCMVFAGVYTEQSKDSLKLLSVQAAEESSEEATAVALSKKKITISKGEKYTLSVTGDYDKVSWKVNRKSIATVSKNGVVKGIKAGTTTVTATIDGEKYKCTVVVEEPVLSETKLTGMVGESYTLSVSGTKRNVYFYSKDKDIATISKKKGTVTLKAAGTVTLYAKVGNYRINCKVTVVEDHFSDLIGYRGERTEQQKCLAEKANQIYNELITPDMTEIEMVRALHDYIVLNTAYDYINYMKGTIPMVSYSEEGVLLNGVAVCQGYAEAMKLFLDALGIENRIVVGTAGGGSHAWNLVKLEENWYHVDATWDDPVMNGADIPGNVEYHYFCIADSKMDDDHTWKKADYPKAEGGEYSTYISDLELAEYREKDMVLKSIDHYESALLKKMAAGERDISLLYPENEVPDLNAVMRTISNTYRCGVSIDYYPQLEQVGDYYLFRIIVYLEN